MSSPIWFSEDITATVWNSTFKTLLAKLEDEVPRYQAAARILAENPVAAQIGALDVQALTNPELREFASIITTLQEQSSAITTGWTSPDQAAQFSTDLEILIGKARQALGAAAGGRKEAWLTRNDLSRIVQGAYQLICFKTV